MGDDLDDDYFEFDNSEVNITKYSRKSDNEDNEESPFIDSAANPTKNDNPKQSGPSKDKTLKRMLPQSPSMKKKKKKKKKQKKVKNMSNLSDSQLLIHTGRSVATQPLESHAAFFNAAYCSSLATSDGSVPSKLDVIRFKPNGVEGRVLEEGQDLDGEFAKLFRDAVVGKGGMKKLKKQRTPGSSPIHVVISSSAKVRDGAKDGCRDVTAKATFLQPMQLTTLQPVAPLLFQRSCEILRLLSPLKTRACKLFSKNMTVSEQVNMLKISAYPFAVGTPNRLLKLAEDGALNFEGTETIVLDMKSDKKGFNVITLRDCMGDLMELVRNHVSGTDCKIMLL